MNYSTKAKLTRVRFGFISLRDDAISVPFAHSTNSHSQWFSFNASDQRFNSILMLAVFFESVRVVFHSVYFIITQRMRSSTAITFMCYFAFSILFFGFKCLLFVVSNAKPQKLIYLNLQFPNPLEAHNKAAKDQIALWICRDVAWGLTAWIALSSLYTKSKLQ